VVRTPPSDPQLPWAGETQDRAERLASVRRERPLRRRAGGTLGGADESARRPRRAWETAPAEERPGSAEQGGG